MLVGGPSQSDVEFSGSHSVTRLAEQSAVTAFLDSAAVSATGLIIDGEPGIGKTTLYRDAVRAASARGFKVMTAQGDPGEVTFSFAALSDLLAGVDHESFECLSSTQRAMVNSLLLHDHAPAATDERGAAAAFQSVVQWLSARTPVLIAIDDGQWLDTPSATAIRYVARRVQGPIGVLVTTRSGEPGSLEAQIRLQMAHPDALRRVHMTPLTMGGLHALVTKRHGKVLPRPQMRRIQEISGGNPFYALELVRAVEDGRGIDGTLPETLAAIVAARLQGLEQEAAPLLLAAACAAKPTVEMVSQATGVDEERVVELLERGEAAHVVAVVGTAIEFSHALLSAGVYDAAQPADRRAMHRRLAELVDAPELKARHLALAATSADPATLAALDAAAVATREHGAPTAAAELVELAIALGGDDPIRRILAARYHFDAGAIAAARQHLKGLSDDLPTGAIRGAVVILQGAIDGYDGSFTAAVEGLTRGLEDAVESPHLRLQALMTLAPATGITGDFEQALAYAREAVDVADQIPDTAFQSQARALAAMLHFQYGRGVEEHTITEALRLQGSTPFGHVHHRADAVKAVIDAGTGDLQQAQQVIQALREHAADRGNEIDAIWVDTQATMINIWSGRYDDAATIAEEATRRAEEIDGHHPRVFAASCRAAVAAHTGREQEAREAADLAIALAHATGGIYLARSPLTSLGFLETSLGNYTAAINAFEPLLRTFDPAHDTELISGGYLPDAIEALTALGRLDEAQPLIEALETNGNRLQRPWMLATGARGRCLWLAARGDLPAAEATALTALEHHRELPMPFETARTRLVLGQIQRRRRHRKPAEDHLVAAHHAFERLGAPLWLRRAAAELNHLKRSTTRGAGLTPAEERVARRAADGLSNREIAAELFISPKTVEMNLSNVYRKLGIRSRSQLHTHLPDANTREIPGT
nr:LuxR family transcriptional regulator [Mycobacterium neumannii]